VVVGDPVGLMAALELAQVARQVTLVAPTHGELDTPLGKHLQTLPNVLILEEYAPVQVNGDDFARSLVVKKGDDQRELATDVIFVELGLKPNSEFLVNLIELEPDGRIKIDNNNRASLPGIFAAGDVTNVYAEQVLIAVGEGAKAALAAEYCWPSRPKNAPCQ
jgi:alkyl hydroperoxide reductase subunit AhpF